MSLVTALYVALTFLLWKYIRDKKLTVGSRVAIGVFYGILSIMSTHFAIDYGDMLLNVRDLGPMSAGLFFDPVSGIIAGLIGGIERYIVGTYYGIGAYTTIACSVSTCLAGFFAAFLRKYIFKDKYPSIMYAFFMGSVIEVFHMYVVFITHRDDMRMAFYVVKSCSLPMIFFSGIGLAMISTAIKKSCDGLHNPLIPIPANEVPVSNRFQVWLFGVTLVVLILNFGFNYDMQSQAALQSAKTDLVTASRDIGNSVSWLHERGSQAENYTHHVGINGSFLVFDSDDNLLAGLDVDKENAPAVLELIRTHEPRVFFTAEYRDNESLCLIRKPNSYITIFTQIPVAEVYQQRDVLTYEIILTDILLFTVIYMLISMLVQSMVADKLSLVNESLDKITDGDLNERVNVYSSMEFASLSNDINHTVDVLKGYIDAAEKRMEQELKLAHTIQDSALPKNFDFNHDGFEVYATMNPAKFVGGDFYDCFFVDSDMIALVIADVAGKGIPASLFMMRSKTAIRSLAETGSPAAEVLEKVNKELCAGNEAEMFVTVWIGIVDLNTGNVSCVNAGHEYPAIMHKGAGYDLFRDKHRPPLGVMEDMTFSEYEMHLDPGDCLYVYTDGVHDAFNTQGEQYGVERMLIELNANTDASMRDLLEAVKQDIDKFAGDADQFDDITMIGFRYLGPQGK